jgi:hypothetical protein
VDGTRAGANEIVGSASGKTGMHALQDVDLFNLLSIPETYDMTDLQAAAVIPRLGRSVRSAAPSTSSMPAG